MDISMFSTPNLLQNAAVLTLILAFVSYLATFMSARMLARRKDKLELVNRRLNEFYGPLYVASQAGSIAYRSLLKKQGKTQSFPILDEEMKEWVLWMTTIFMPLNDVREKIIIQKAYLIVEEEMPKCLLEFVTHVVGYKAVLSKWAEGDYTERRSTIGWAPGVGGYIGRSHQALHVGRRRQPPPPPHHRLPAGFRRLHRALLQGPQSKPNPPAAQRALAALS